MREADTRRGRLDQVRAAVREWKAGNISAPEAMARVARAVDITLVGEPVKKLDPDDPRLGARLVTREITSDGGRVEVELECGHVVTQIVPIGRHLARRMRCAQCVNALIDEHRGRND